jgi:hypothetical protein
MEKISSSSRLRNTGAPGKSKQIRTRRGLKDGTGLAQHGTL